MKSNTIKINLLLVGLLFIINLNGQNLDKHKWKNRILIVNGAIEASKSYQNQIEELIKTREELKERKLVLYEIKGDKFKFTDFQKLENEDAWKDLKEIDHNVLIKSSIFKIILIGLDGGIKLEQFELLKTKELFDLIDAMPMRLEELNQQKTKN